MVTFIQYAKFSGSILCLRRLYILFIVLKWCSTEAVPIGHTKIIVAIIERLGKVSAKSYDVLQLVFAISPFLMALLA